MQRLAEITAVESAAGPESMDFSPVLDLGTATFVAPFYESFGEDPYLAKVLGAAFVRV